MRRAALALALLLSAALAVVLSIVAVASPRAAHRAIAAILCDVSPGGWLDQLRSRVVPVAARSVRTPSAEPASLLSQLSPSVPLGSCRED
jgi:hypothetical protein